MLGFKNFDSAQNKLAGIELMGMIKKGQMKKKLSSIMSPAEQCYALAFYTGRIFGISIE